MPKDWPDPRLDPEPFVWSWQFLSGVLTALAAMTLLVAAWHG